MSYELDYTVWREFKSAPGVFERERGTLEFADVHTAQEFCATPNAMLEWFGAERGEFALYDEECDLLWRMAYDVTAMMNRLPVTYRVWRDSIYEMSA